MGNVLQPPDNIRKNIGPALSAVIMSAMKLEGEHRPQSISVFLQMVKTGFQSQAVSSQTTVLQAPRIEKVGFINANNEIVGEVKDVLGILVNSSCEPYDELSVVFSLDKGMYSKPLPINFKMRYGVLNAQLVQPQSLIAGEKFNNKTNLHLTGVFAFKNYVFKVDVDRLGDETEERVTRLIQEFVNGLERLTDASIISQIRSVDDLNRLQQANAASKAKTRIRELKLQKKELQTKKREVTAQLAEMRADHRNAMARTQPNLLLAIAGKAALARQLESNEKKAARRRLSYAVAPLEETKMDIDRQIAEIDSLIIETERNILQQGG